MFLEARLPRGAAGEPTSHLRRAIWFAVRRRVYYSEVAANLAQIYASADKPDAAEAYMKDYIRLSDPTREDAEDKFVERGRDMMRRIKDGAHLEIAFSDEEIREAQRETLRKGRKGRIVL